LTPNKSRTIEFPDIPEKYIRHFIRGCWDGDGSVAIRWLDYMKTKPKITASFVSGSRSFIESMATELEKAGLPKRNIDRDRESYQIKFSDNQCKLLYEYIYSGVLPEQYLERKYQVFKDYFGNL
jgi:intein-encoded DNA endonuclease-like protein